LLRATPRQLASVFPHRSAPSLKPKVQSREHRSEQRDPPSNVEWVFDADACRASPHERMRPELSSRLCGNHGVTSDSVGLTSVAAQTKTLCCPMYLPAAIAFMTHEPTDSSPTRDGQRCCAVCGKPIYSRHQVHPTCVTAADMNPATDAVKQRRAPQKACERCGHENHVRKLVCGRCGAMF